MKLQLVPCDVTGRYSLIHKWSCMSGAPRDADGGEKFGHDSDDGPRVQQKEKFVAPVQYFDISPHVMDTDERRLADEMKEFRRTGMLTFEDPPRAWIRFYCRTSCLNACSG